MKKFKQFLSNLSPAKIALLKLVGVLLAIVILFSSLARLLHRSGETLADLETRNQTTGPRFPDTETMQSEESRVTDTETAQSDESRFTDTETTQSKESRPTDNETTQSEESWSTDTETIQADDQNHDSSFLTVGALLNGEDHLEERVDYQEGFYYEPISDHLRRYMTGISYPIEPPKEITIEELRYVHVLHYDFSGEVQGGDFICNVAIAQDLVEIFYELYQNEYQIAKIRLIEEYDGDDDAAVADNNTSCFNYRPVEGSANLSKHAYGLAIDINPFYNPYVTYNNDGTVNISPKGAEFYADRSQSFAYKIDETDLCYRLFTEKGFLWGGNWNSLKDYQHFYQNPT